ncbi:MAG: TIGR04282 family arsenosugar biosynthesis glycosyltransferase [Oscillospiraceae bacterium]|nr:TIGR04282 family arsenosugar biosynthesis glycosyltransferase [Oscillospiraceae bacterium]
MKNAVICFTRVPKPGKTKTRLMPCLTGDQCAQLHWAFLRDLAEIYDQVEADLFVAYTDDPDWESLKTVFPNARFYPQVGEGLGEKMNNALNVALALGYEKVVLTGSDLPLMTAEHLRSGFAALENADVTLGPTADGGYYLVGVKERSPFLFEKQTYGYGSVFENTAAAARSAGKTVTEALSCNDVDTPEDLQKLIRSICPDSHTARYLHLLGELK